MPNAIAVYGTAFYKMAHEAVGVVGAFVAIPVHGLAGVVLLGSHVRCEGHRR